MKVFIFSLCYLYTVSFCFGQKGDANTEFPTTRKQKTISKDEMKFWYRKDIKEDTIPGISLDKAYRELLSDLKGEEIIVAVLDTKLDIMHKDLRGQIWVNSGEIADNGIDDDVNGYIDDINGWDFLGNKKGEYVKYQNLVEVRIIRYYKALFDGKKIEEISPKDTVTFNKYIKAKKRYKKAIEDHEEDVVYINNVKKWRLEVKEKLRKYFKNDDYTIADLDSLSNVYPDNKQLDTTIIRQKKFMKYFTAKYVAEYEENNKVRVEKTLNFSYKEREIIGDKPNDIRNRNYGYNKVYGDVPFQHSISVSGVLAANRANKIGIKGFSNKIKIMPVVMVAKGDEYEKDIALAIRYAVDNGAKIINMSWGNDLSLHEDWVIDAIKYANKNNVLLVKAAGNGARSVETDNYYPNDYINEKEYVDNLIVVGASGYSLDKELIAYFSNYGKKNVDIFAPGYKIYTTKINDKYDFVNGTSLSSPLVSGLAALIWSHYPNFTANEIKNIILSSGTNYNLNVEIKANGEKIMIPFSDLSKSGKIINVYNALVLAKKEHKKY